MDDVMDGVYFPCLSCGQFNYGLSGQWQAEAVIGCIRCGYIHRVEWRHAENNDAAMWVVGPEGKPTHVVAAASDLALRMNEAVLRHGSASFVQTAFPCRCWTRKRHRFFIDMIAYGERVQKRYNRYIKTG